MSATPYSEARDFVTDIAAHPDFELASRFFILFSRFEYSLKRSGYCKADKDIAEADWSLFANLIADKLFLNDTVEFKQAAEYMKLRPPSRQMRDMTWKVKECKVNSPVGESRWLIDSVRTIRNNLLHGGKYPLIVIDEPARNQLLLQHSMEVLYAFLACDQNVKEIFLDGLNK